MSAVWLPNHENIDVTGCDLLISRERAVQISLVNPFDLVKGLREQRNGTDCLSNDAADLVEKGILAVEAQILLATIYLRTK